MRLLSFCKRPYTIGYLCLIVTSILQVVYNALCSNNLSIISGFFYIQLFCFSNIADHDTLIEQSFMCIVLLRTILNPN